MPVPDARVELQIAGVWTDVTDDVMAASGIQLSRGRSDDGRTSDPGAGSLTLWSPNGKYSNRNPNSENFGQLPRNTQIRYSVAGADTVLDIPDGTFGRATTPDHASLDITSDIDVRAELEPETWAGSISNAFEVLGKYNVTGNQRSWRLLVTDFGRLAFAWSTDGVTPIEKISAKRVDFGPWERGAIRATLDVNNGLGGYTVTWYTAASLAGPWTVLDTLVTTSGTTSIFNSTATLEVGDISSVGFDAMARRLYKAEVRSGIGGTVVASPDFTTQAVGATSFADSAGRTWTVSGGATITDRRTLAVHEVPKWPARWHRSGHAVTAPITSAGILRRLGQGRKSLASTLRRRVPTFSPQAYWPCEDQDGATQAASPIAGVLPAVVTGFRFGQDDTLAGSSPLPTIEAGGVFNGIVPPPPGSPTEWSVHMVYAVDSAPGSDQEFFAWLTTGTVRRWRILQRSGTATVQAFDGEDNVVVSLPIGIGSDVFTGWQRIQFRAVQNGGNVDYRIDWFNIGGAAGGAGSSFAGTVGRVTQIKTVFGSISGLRAGHFTALPVGTPSGAAAPFLGADHGFDGESALTRVFRLGNEEAATVALAHVDGDQDRGAEAMGPQLPRPLLDLLQEPADTDGGYLYENSQRLGLVYRDRASMENQTPKLVVSYAQVTHPFEPDEDDLRLRNDITVVREGGSEGRAVDENGPLGVNAVGLYDESVTLSMWKDHQAQQIAGWRLGFGTWDEARYPAVTILLHRNPELIGAVTSLELGDRIQITGTPSWQPPGPLDLIVQKIEHDLKPFAWTVRLVCSPAGPWTVGVVEDSVLGRPDTAGSSLVSGVSSSATSLSVATTAGPRWIDSAAYSSMFPFDVLCGGELMTVTAITGTTSPQTFTVTRSVNGIVKAQTAGEAVSLANPMRAAL